jgi:hypothetical protein
VSALPALRLSEEEAWWLFSPRLAALQSLRTGSIGRAYSRSMGRPKHQRPIVLETWQRDIVERYPGAFARGLFHSDGCRITNWTTRIVAGRVKRYEYPRYFFSNESTDILAICGWTLDLLGVQWRLPRRNLLSVARAASVAILDEHVGPKK